jgi:CDP-paratose 2-epimerase
VIEYARNLGLPAVVFRMSCIYGPHQSGTEDQGWVAHFLMRAMEGLPITIYGDGAQSRDLLFVDDLVDALLLAQANVRALAARAFNIGGGPLNLASLRDVLRLIGELRGETPAVRFAPWRPGDQRYFASDTRAFQLETGWEPKVEVREGIAKLLDWLSETRESVTPAMKVAP